MTGPGVLVVVNTIVQTRHVLLLELTSTVVRVQLLLDGPNLARIVTCTHTILLVIPTVVVIVIIGISLINRLVTLFLATTLLVIHLPSLTRLFRTETEDGKVLLGKDRLGIFGCSKYIIELLHGCTSMVCYGELRWIEAEDVLIPARGVDVIIGTILIVVILVVVLFE